MVNIVLVKVIGKKERRGNWRKSKPSITFRPDILYEVDTDCLESWMEVQTPKAEAPVAKSEPVVEEAISTPPEEEVREVKPKSRRTKKED